MGLFGRKTAKNRCPDCCFYVMVEGHGFCAKDAPSNVDVRRLTGPGIKRLCPRCPAEMTCESWTAK